MVTLHLRDSDRNGPAYFDFSYQDYFLFTCSKTNVTNHKYPIHKYIYIWGFTSPGDISRNFLFFKVRRCCFYWCFRRFPMVYNRRFQGCFKILRMSHIEKKSITFRFLHYYVTSAKIISRSFIMFPVVSCQFPA